MAERRTNRLRFGIRALLILVAVVAGVFFYLRNGPLLAKPREVVWISGPTPSNGFRSGRWNPRQSSIVLRYEWHPWTTWRRRERVQIRLHHHPDQSTPFPGRQDVRMNAYTLAAEEKSRFFGESVEMWQEIGPETALAWNKNWGNPEFVLDEFVGDNNVEVWTPEAFLEWINARE